MLYLLIIGLVSILAQAVLLRELAVAFYGVDLIYSLGIGIWLVWTAAGALIGRRRPGLRSDHTPALFLLFSLFVPADVVFIRAIRILFSDVPGAYLPFASQMMALSGALLPIGLLSGLLFRRAAQAYVTGGRTLAAAYAMESAGGLAGGLSATLFLRFGFQNFSIALFCALVSLGAACTGCRRSGRWFRTLVAGSALVMICLFIVAGTADRALTAWDHPDLLVSQDTPYGRMTVTQQGGQTAVYENDALSFETEGTEAEEFAHMAALLHARPDRVLILGGGIAGTVREVLKHQPALVDYVELNRPLLTEVAPRLALDLQESLRAAPVHIFIDDPRRFLASAPRYDLILIGMPEPESGPANRFYTLDFFRQCAGHLNPEGIMAFRMKSAENFWTPQQTQRAISLYRTLQAALPNVQVLPGATNIFLASEQPLPNDPSLPESRLEARGIRARLVSRPYVRYVYTNDRFAQTARVLEAGSAPLNTDEHPVCYHYTLMIWMSKFYPALRSFNTSIPSWWNRQHPLVLWTLLAAITALFLAARGNPSWRRTLLAGLAGFVGMVYETVLVLNYQVKSGILYQDIGVILTGFMAGLTLGAWMSDQSLGHGGPWIRRMHGPLSTGGLALLGLALWVRLDSGALAGLPEATVLLLITGFLVSAVFAYATLEGTQDQMVIVAPRYAADLLGGCLGSLVSTLLLIPLAGMGVTAALMVPLALVSVLLLPLNRSRA